MLHYIIQTIAFQCFFLIAYDLFLKKETFFNWNRVYLLATTIVSFIIPFIKIDSFKNVIPQEFIITLPEIILGNPETIMLNDVVIDNGPVVTNTIFTWQIFLYLGVFIASILFVYKIINVLLLIHNNPKEVFGKIILVKLKKSSSAFSFFNYIFLGELIKPEDKDAILKHEMAHVKQKHSIDLLLFEILRIVFWFNPFIYIYQNRIADLHEYLADIEAIKHQDKTSYYHNLLAKVFQTKRISFINPFYKQSLIKKRIVMLNKSKSKKVQLFKYALLVPIMAVMLTYSSCSNETQVQEPDQELEAIVNKFRNQLLTENSNFSKQDRIELAEYIIDAFKANLEDNGQTSSGSFTASSFSSEEVSFTAIEQVPVFPGCEDAVNNEERKKCMATKVGEFVGKKFNVDLAESLGLAPGKHRISVQFKVNENGNIIDVKSRAPHAALEKEAIRIVNLLPKMKPGMHLGKAVTVPYGFPIQFQIKG
ncbi:M56 family metallopeptidase [Lacinutrix cladophorae]